MQSPPTLRTRPVPTIIRDAMVLAIVVGDAILPLLGAAHHASSSLLADAKTGTSL